MPPEVWKRSLDEWLVGYDRGVDLDGYVWGVKWQNLYPGIGLLPEPVDAALWSQLLELSFHEAIVETNATNLSLVSDLAVDTGRRRVLAIRRA